MFYLEKDGYIFIIPTHWFIQIRIMTLLEYIPTIMVKNQMHIFCRVNVVLLRYSTNKHDYEYYIHIATNIYDIDLVKQLL